MLLEDKHAIIRGAGGAIGGAVARACAREGAQVFLAGRTLAKLDAVAETSHVDALDQQAIERHAAAVTERAGGIDFAFNAVGIADVQGTPLLAMSLEEFARPVMLVMRTQFLTAMAVARHMARKRSGVILTITATPVRLAIPNTGGFGPACAAIEGLYRQLAGCAGYARYPHANPGTCRWRVRENDAGWWK